MRYHRLFARVSVVGLIASCSPSASSPPRTEAALPAPLAPASSSAPLAASVSVPDIPACPPMAVATSGAEAPRLVIQASPAVEVNDARVTPDGKLALLADAGLWTWDLRSSILVRVVPASSFGFEPRSLAWDDRSSRLVVRPVFDMGASLSDAVLVGLQTGSLRHANESERKAFATDGPAVLGGVVDSKKKQVRYDDAAGVSHTLEFPADRVYYEV